MTGAIAALARHRVAPNVLMLIMLVSGFLAIGRIETRFFPEFQVQAVSVRATWSGASAEDVDRSLITPLLNNLRNVENYKKIDTTAQDGSARIYIEFPQDVNIDRALENVRRQTDAAAASLPTDSDTPEVSAPEQRDMIMRLALSGENLAELRTFARNLERQLLALNIGSVKVSGLPTDKIEIRFSQRQLAQLGLSPREVGKQIAAQNIDTSAGRVDGDTGGQRLRAVSKQRDLAGLSDVRILDGQGNPVRLGEVATISRAQDDDQTTLLFNGRPAVEYEIQRQTGGDTLVSGEAITQWGREIRTTLPPSLHLSPTSERWKAIKSRKNLLLENGAQGLLLVAIFLFIFLNARVAFWVAVGIPVTFMTALAALYLFGGTINMISLFAFIMTTGIVVDDAIVVGENAHYRLRHGDPPLTAASHGAGDMLAAVTASTFTTVASFLPLLVIGGVIGAILVEIPIIVICVLTASLLECFTILPGHLTGAFTSMPRRDNRWRAALEHGFARFQEIGFRRALQLALRYRLATVVLCLSFLAVSITILTSGTVKYRFFSGPELSRINIQANFFAGTPRAKVERFATHLEETLQAAATAFPQEENLVVSRVIFLGGGGRQGSGDEKLSMRVELSQPDDRNIRVADFVREWQRRVQKPAGLESLQMRERRGGPRGEELEIRLFGDNLDTLKAASLALQARLAQVAGVSLPRDDTPRGQQQSLFELTPLGRSLGLSVESVAAQLRDSFDGYTAQTFYNDADEVKLRVVMDGADGDGLREFSGFLLRLPDGRLAPLEDMVRLRKRQGFDEVRRIDGKLAININAEVDFKKTDEIALHAQLRNHELPIVADTHGVSYSFEGGKSDERETVADMRAGLIFSLLLIYVILAVVFASWTLPFVVLLTTPLAVAGAIFGHWLMGYTMSILSAFGVFTLNGIVINNSIILLREYMARQAQTPQADTNTLIIDATCRRLRAILLTSLTTIAGLTPLMFESSTQAQFLIPMAISICFGLAFATLLILFLAPVYLSYHESAAHLWLRLRVRLGDKKSADY